MAKIKISEGDVFVIDLQNAKAFGIVLPDTWAFFDYFPSQEEPIDIEKITSSNIAFKIWVSEFSLKKELWRIIGNIELDSSLKEEVYFYKQDPINNEVWRTKTGAEEWPISVEECRDLEVAAVWDPEHVEERLNHLYQKEEDLDLKYDLDLLNNKGVSTS